jgi:hypothetical protein
MRRDSQIGDRLAEQAQRGADLIPAHHNRSAALWVFLVKRKTVQTFTELGGLDRIPRSLVVFWVQAGRHSPHLQPMLRNGDLLHCAEAQDCDANTAGEEFGHHCVVSVECTGSQLARGARLPGGTGLLDTAASILAGL